MDYVVTPLERRTLTGFSVYLNVQLKFYNLPYTKSFLGRRTIVTRLYEVGIAEMRMLSETAKQIGKTIYVDINGQEYRIPK